MAAGEDDVVGGHGSRGAVHGVHAAASDPDVHDRGLVGESGSRGEGPVGECGRQDAGTRSAIGRVEQAAQTAVGVDQRRRACRGLGGVDQRGR